MNREIRLFILFFGMSFVIFGAIAFAAILIFFVNSNASYEIATTMLYICLIVSAANALLSGVLFKLWEE